jgi:hypothetical protein
MFHVDLKEPYVAPITLPAVRWLQRPQIEITTPAAHLAELRVVKAGVEAWSRLRRNTSYEDWLSVARALAVGREYAMRVAHADKPCGPRYVAAIGTWLRQHHLDGVTPQERYKALLVLDHLDEITEWRADLDENQRRRLNHPSAILAHWRRVTRPRRQAKQIDVAAALRQLAAAMRDTDPERAELPLDEAQAALVWLQRHLSRVAVAPSF